MKATIVPIMGARTLLAKIRRRKPLRTNVIQKHFVQNSALRMVVMKNQWRLDHFPRKWVFAKNVEENHLRNLEKGEKERNNRELVEIFDGPVLEEEG